MTTRTRKTFEVEALRERVNFFNELGAVLNNDRTEARDAVNALLETVLHDTGNYKGFRYLDGTEAVHSGSYDESRRYYY